VANFHAIAATGTTIERFLNASFENSFDKKTLAKLVRTEDFDTKTSGVIPRPGLSIFLYRVDFNKTMRAAWSAVGQYDGRAHLPLDLHFLLTAWGENAEQEHAIMGRALQALETTPILSGPLLSASAEWSTNEAIQFVLEELSTEAVMRTFDSLPTEYRLSVPYIARVIRLDGQRVTAAPPVTDLITGITASPVP
jgi:uncharacterized protein DUF4255